MPARKRPQPDDPEQYQRFLDMAREVEADESQDAMDRVFDRLKPAIVSPPPKPEPKKRRPRRGKLT